MLRPTLAALVLAAIVVISAADSTADTDLFELDPTAFASPKSPGEAKIAEELLSIRDQIVPLHNQICQDSGSEDCVLRTRANAEIIQDVLSRRCYRKTGCLAANKGVCAKLGCKFLRKLAHKNKKLQDRYTRLYKVYMGTYARYYRRRFERLARVAHATKAKLNKRLAAAKEENRKLKAELKEFKDKANDAADDADDTGDKLKAHKNKLANAKRERALALKAMARERALVARMQAALRATKRKTRANGAKAAKTHAAKVAWYQRTINQARRRSSALGGLARRLAGTVHTLRRVLRHLLRRTNLAALASRRTNGALNKQVRSLQAQANQWRKRYAACARGSAKARRAHADLKRRTQQLANKAKNMKRAQHQGQINRNVNGGWKHVMTLGSASILSTKAVGHKGSDSFKLSDAAINAIGGKQGVEFKIDFNGKLFFWRPVKTSGGTRPFATTSDVGQWKFKENQAWMGPCGHRNQNSQYYFMFFKTNCKYGSSSCTCANGNFENAVYKSGFKNRDNSNFFPMQGWSPMIKMFAKKTTVGTKTTFATRYTGADGRERGWVNNRVLDFIKNAPNTDMKLSYYDNMRIYRNHRNGGHCRWEIRIDGRSCPSGGVGGDVYLWNSGNLHRPRLITGYCRGIRQGRHRMQIYVSNHGHADCYTGWHTGQTSWTMEAQEIPTNHKALGLYYRTSHSGADGSEHAWLNNRQLSFHKKNDNTWMRFMFKDDLRTHAGGGGHSCRWLFKVDNRDCPSGRIGGDVYIWGAKNTHRPRVIMGYCRGIRRGNHQLRMFVTRTPGYGGDCYTGWHSQRNGWTMEAEEILPNQLATRHFRTAYSGADGRDHGWVNDRHLNFEKKGNGPMKLTYADNMRTYTPNGRGRSCRWEIRVDGGHCPSGKIAGDVYVWTQENSHRPRVITGFCKGVKAGRHQLRVWVSPTPGYGGSDCYTGWYAQQTSWTLEAIEVEE